MKKILSMLLLMVLLLSSCNSTPSQPNNEITGKNPYTKNYLYTAIEGVMYKINVVTGNASPLCPDPLCAHLDKKCAFYGMSETDIAFVGKYLYYLCGQGDSFFSSGYTQLRRFDLKEGKSEVLFASESGTLNELLVGNDFVFMTNSVMDESFTSKYRIVRYSLKNNKASFLTQEPDADCPIPFGFDNDMVVWQNRNGKGFFATDTDYKNKKEISDFYHSNLTLGKYAYKIAPTGQFTESGIEGTRLPYMSLTAENLETGDKKVLFEDLTIFPILYGDKILYCKYEPIFLGEEAEVNEGEPTGNKISVYEKHGGKIYICNNDGTEEKLLCDINAKENLYAFRSYLGGLSGKRGEGDWVGTWITRYKSADVDLIERAENAILLINVKTGEYKICEVK